MSQQACLVIILLGWALSKDTQTRTESKQYYYFLYISNSGIIVMIIMSIITITFAIIVTSIIATSSRKAPEGWGVRWTDLIFAAA